MPFYPLFGPIYLHLHRAKPSDNAAQHTCVPICNVSRLTTIPQLFITRKTIHIDILLFLRLITIGLRWICLYNVGSNDEFDMRL